MKENKAELLSMCFNYWDLNKNDEVVIPLIFSYFECSENNTEKNISLKYS